MAAVTIHSGFGAQAYLQQFLLHSTSCPANKKKFQNMPNSKNK